MYECPHCGERGISVLRKLFLGPGKPTTCRACGQKVGVPGWTLAVAVGLALVIYVGAMVVGFSREWAVLCVVCLAMLIPIWLWWVPLVKR